ncbi:Polymyxin resistance protein ArnT [Minicystis rosea]|nr:Polymyxin resistance protein ArnT [Minicystis rosea]
MAASREAETGERPDPQAKTGDPLSRSRIVALGAAVLVLFPALAWSGIWDPYELDAGDLARRIALRVFGARALDLPNAVNSLPTLTDLRMGELPFTSMALGFKLFGLHDWTGRLPLALWGLAGVAVLFEFLARLVDRRAGIYAAVALVTMPLYFMQARTMLGDIVTMAALSLAFCGLAGALLDGDRRTDGVSRPQIAWLAIGVVGLVAGYFSRGALLGVAVPALSAGATWVILRGSGESRPWSARDAIGALALAAGVAALGVGIRAFLHATPEAPLARVLGFAVIKKPPTEATFDLVVRQLGHALFPWSAFLPFAFGRLLRAPVEADVDAREREIGVRVALLVGAATAYGAYAMIAPRTGPLAFSGPALLAGVAALAVFDLERGAPASRALALGSGVFGAVLLADILREPEKALAAFVVDKPQFPKSFEADSARRLVAVFVLFVVVSALVWIETQPRGWFRGFDDYFAERRREYRSICTAVARVWQGNLLFGMVVVEAALVGLGAMIFVGRRVGWAPVDRLPKNFADLGVNLWWIAPVAILAALPVWWLDRDLFRGLVDATRLPRARFVVIGALLAGAVQSFWYYPALAGQLSPKEAFDAYAHLAAPGEPLALLSVRSRAAAYYAGSDVESFTDATRAFAWLTERKDQRRFLLVKADDLPKLNQLYRAHAGKNLPILDGRSSQILLASNVLGDRRNESWLSKLVLDEPPQPSVSIDTSFDDQLTAFGWEVTDKTGRVVNSVVPATSYHLRVYYRVQKPVTGTWKAFVHIDGFQRRFNGDHNVLDGKYAMNLWRPGDVVVDDLPFQLEPNFTPGDYTVYFGFFSGDTRFKVTRGQHHDNRAIAGVIHVR